jgi:hypothetical protein
MFPSSVSQHSWNKCTSAENWKIVVCALEQSHGYCPGWQELVDGHWVYIAASDLDNCWSAIYHHTSALRCHVIWLTILVAIIACTAERNSKEGQSVCLSWTTMHCICLCMGGVYRGVCFLVTQCCTDHLQISPRIDFSMDLVTGLDNSILRLVNDDQGIGQGSVVSPSQLNHNQQLMHFWGLKFPIRLSACRKVTDHGGLGEISTCSKFRYMVLDPCQLENQAIDLALLVPFTQFLNIQHSSGHTWKHNTILVPRCAVSDIPCWLSSK